MHLGTRPAGRLLDAVLLPLLLIPHTGQQYYPIHAGHTPHRSDRRPPLRTIGRSGI
jgi:hypothetical protein